MADRVGCGVGGDLGQPGVEVAGADRAQHRVDELRPPVAEDRAGELDGLAHGRVVRDAQGEQLVGAEPQDVEHLTVDGVERPVDAGRDHQVVGAGRAQGAVRQLGGERGVATLDAALAQQPGQHEVRVGVVHPDGAQGVEGRPPRRVGVRASVRALGAAHPPSRSPGSSRRPRAQSAAGIVRLPSGPTSPSRTACDPVPTRTPARSTTTSPGASTGPSSVGRRPTGPELEPLPAHRRPGAGGRRAGTDQPVDAQRGCRPVHPGVVGGDLRRERDTVRRLRLRLDHRPGRGRPGTAPGAGRRSPRAAPAGRRWCRWDGWSR